MGGTVKGRRDADDKETILFMLDVAVMLIFRCAIKLGRPHQSPPRLLSGQHLWLLNNFFFLNMLYVLFTNQDEHLIF